MAESYFTNKDLVAAISDGQRSQGFFTSRVRDCREAEVLPVASRTPGGLALYNNDARIIVAVANVLADWGLQHSGKLPATARANPSPSPLWAISHALDATTLGFIVDSVRHGRDWLLRIDLVPGENGEPIYWARPFPITAEGNYGETPSDATSTLSIGLSPLIRRFVGEA